MADFLDELKEDIQHEKFQNLWGKWGPFVIGTAVALLIGAAIVPMWRSHQESQMKLVAARYEAAVSLLDRGNAAEGQKQLKELMKDDTGYAVLAALQLAGFANQESSGSPQDADVAKAIAKLYGETYADPAMHGLTSYINIVRHLKSSEPSKAFNAIEEMVAPEYPYRAVGFQLLATYYLKTGDKAKALQALETLASEKNLNPDLRTRAKLIASYLKQS